MLVQFEESTAAKLYEEGLHQLRISGETAGSRNGQVIQLPDVAYFTLHDPRARVIDDPVRNANPYFHMMEFIWMMAGRLDVEWLMQFNKRMGDYADTGMLHAAYGHRWRYHYSRDQIANVIEILAKEPSTRQAVVQMWDPDMDAWSAHKDKACNVSIAFRYTHGALDCLVFNRSNDFVWGALGANICHLTMLHETVAHFTGLPLGKYSVVSNNLHIYTGMPRFREIFSQRSVNDVYAKAATSFMFTGGETYFGFVNDCESFCNDGLFDSPWLKNTATPAYQSWIYRDAIKAVEMPDPATHIQAEDWRIACLNYKQRISSSATSTEPSP